MTRYKMLGRDVDATPTQYRTWVVEGSPDFTGDFYTGLKSGDRPFEDIKAYLIDGYSNLDFNFPISTAPHLINWVTTEKELPEPIYGGQLFILDGYVDGHNDGYDGYNTGYVYIVGGKLSNKIWRASLNKPTEWVDTGDILPSSLYGSQLAVINDRIYLFGGESDLILDTVYSASIYSPTDWINHGSCLPKPLKKSQLAIINDDIYLFGGYSVNGAVDVIFKSSSADPLSWQDTGLTLPMALYESHLGIVNNNVYLFGGQTSTNTQSSAILMASLDDPTAWFQLGNLPYPMSGGEFFTVGDKGYLISPGPAHPKNFRTKIFRCNLSSPTQWVNTQKYIPGTIYDSHLAIIYDRIYLFGGNGMSIIFACNSLIKYDITDPTVIAYADITRTQYNNTSNKLDLFKLLGFPNWKTDYGS